MKKIGAGYSIDRKSSLKISDLKKLMKIQDISEDWHIIYVIAER